MLDPLHEGFSLVKSSLILETNGKDQAWSNSRQGYTKKNADPYLDALVDLKLQELFKNEECIQPLNRADITLQSLARYPSSEGKIFPVEI